MGNEYEIFSLSDQALTFSLGNHVNIEVNQKLVSMRHWLVKQKIVGVRDIIVAYSSLTVHYDYFEIRRLNNNLNVSAFLSSILADAFHQSARVELPSRHWRIPVCYGNNFGPDLEFVASEKKVSIDAVVNIHCAIKYTVFMIGFLPGFPYLGETDFRIHVSRKQTPRAVVEAGSVALAGKQTGIYPIKSPGGWQVIGRTPVTLFDPKHNPPVKLQIGDTISFFQIDEREFSKMSIANS